jgi:hypothetical protein
MRYLPLYSTQLSVREPEVIDVVTDVLRREGLLSDCDNISTNIVSGKSINMQVFPTKGNQFWNVKVAHKGLEREYCALHRALTVFPDSVPTPLALRQCGGFDFLVTLGIAVHCVRRVSVELTAFVKSFLEMTTTEFREPDDVSHRRFLSDLCCSGYVGEWSAELGSWLASWPSGVIDRMPHVAQHGDFCLLNVGVKRGRYIIFDWEDFGRVSLPGFDLAVLVMSLLGWKADAVISVLGGSGPEEARQLLIFLKNMLEVSEMGLRDIIKVYAIIFLHLKRSLKYRPPIISATSELLVGLPTLSAGG